MTQAAIAVQALSKIYSAQKGSAAKVALDHVSLEVPRGSLFGLLGPNGAGKSTLINILAGLTNKTSGTASVWGFDIDEDSRNAKLAIGVVPQELVFDAFFTPLEVLDLQAGLYGVPHSQRRSMEILRALKLDDKAHAYARTLSGGMKRRLLIAKALVHAPPILVLDEPTAGVDLELRTQLWAYVRELHAKGTTVVLTTHYLEEAQELCDRIAIIHRGKVVANADKATLMAQASDKVLSILVDRDLDAVPTALAGYRAELRGTRRLAVTYDKRTGSSGPILAAVIGAGMGVEDVSTEEANLEDVFLHFTSDAPPHAA
jgi:ABC-2 type transport system ATP-binding protein